MAERLTATEAHYVELAAVVGARNAARRAELTRRRAARTLAAIARRMGVERAEDETDEALRERIKLIFLGR